TATAQVILLAVGYLHRMKSKILTSLSRSSQYLHAVSNRLGASLPRARFLGMIVGTGVSRLVDAPDKAMKFDMEEMESDDARRFLDLVNIADKIGDLEDLKRHTTMTKPASTRSSKIPEQEMRQAPKKGLGNYTSKIISIEEVEEGEGSDDDLIPYQKP